MFATDDTILAIATPPGRGGIGVVRISGPDAAHIAGALTSVGRFAARHATLTSVKSRDGGVIDRAIVTYFPAPHSYTGEDVVEISAHGSPIVLEQIVAAALDTGARLANPGEFTLRAYLNGRMDLVQAESVADLINAVTPLQARVACDALEGTLTDRIRRIDAGLMDLIVKLEASLDFPEEGYHFVESGEATCAIDAALAGIDAMLADARRGRLIREGLTLAIVGPPNAGKSTLFNSLVGADRAIVTDVPGTTRDLLTERIDLHGIAVTIVDTAGLRLEAADAIEQEGIARARAAAEAAAAIIVVVDSSQPPGEIDECVPRDGKPHVLVAAKADLPGAWDAESAGAVRVSAVSGEGLDRLRQAIVKSLDIEPSRDSAAIANVRHVQLMAHARDALVSARDAAQTGAPEEFVLADLHDARAAFDEIVGARTPDDVLRSIFERFCIGK
ncbi:MAG TPA: tRNA uridine-5-carboxymethylaminomethyl(34) synthesis GTPase MnmE [Vicinamibacterales bacterium]|jgi:tRNA modification GTPase|nr:tRNA uridine-5-carboxymethylaminomethyl(34) synthesis GTPase MnmE [Vicinamibacterales bacterium]